MKDISRCIQPSHKCKFYANNLVRSHRWKCRSWQNKKKRGIIRAACRSIDWRTEQLKRSFVHQQAPILPPLKLKSRRLQRAQLVIELTPWPHAVDYVDHLRVDDARPRTTARLWLPRIFRGTPDIGRSPLDSRVLEYQPRRQPDNKGFGCSGCPDNVDSSSARGSQRLAHWIGGAVGGAIIATRLLTSCRRRNEVTRRSKYDEKARCMVMWCYALYTWVVSRTLSKLYVCFPSQSLAGTRTMIASLSGVACGQCDRSLTFDLK